MSQKNVEIVVGRLATDEDFRREYEDDPLSMVTGLVDRGFELTRAEVSALVTLDPAAFERFANALDPRLQKASLKDGQPGRPAPRRVRGDAA